MKEKKEGKKERKKLLVWKVLEECTGMRLHHNWELDHCRVLLI